MHLKITAIYIYPQLHHFFFFFFSSSSSLQLFFSFFLLHILCCFLFLSLPLLSYRVVILSLSCISLSYSYYYYYYHCGVSISSLPSLSSPPQLLNFTSLSLPLYIQPSSCSSSQCPCKHRICILPLQTLPLTRLRQQQHQQHQRLLPAIRAPKSPPDLSSPFKPPHSRERLAVRQPVSLFR